MQGRERKLKLILCQPRVGLDVEGCQQLPRRGDAAGADEVGAHLPETLAENLVARLEGEGLRAEGRPGRKRGW